MKSEQEMVYEAVEEVTGKQVSSDEDVLKDLVEDSIQLFELVLALEAHLGKDLDYSKLDNIKTIKDAIDFITHEQSHA